MPDACPRSRYRDIAKLHALWKLDPSRGLAAFAASVKSDPHRLRAFMGGAESCEDLGAWLAELTADIYGW